MGPLWASHINKKCHEAYLFVNPDVVCGSPDVIKKTGYSALQSSLETYIEGENRSVTSEVSVYYRDLIHGPAWGINDLADFAPASLLKVPIAMVFLGAAETQPEVLQKKVVYEGSTKVTEQRTPPRVSAVPGREYSIEELLKLMLIYSDNASYEALDSFTSNEPRRLLLRHQVFQELGLIDPRDETEEVLTVRSYASLFRIIYNASYLSEADSEKLLSWLAESDYVNGLRAGVPPEISLAHKFGERDLSNGMKQLHDCGIVYYPRNPYLLCVMTKGKDFADLEQVIKRISTLVYDEVRARTL